jgi:predicted DNA-binding protein
MEAKQQICVRLRIQELEALKALSEKYDIPIAWFIRRSIQEYLTAVEKGVEKHGR